MALTDQLYATCASGLDQLLADEIRALGATEVNSAGAGVRFSGSLDVAYKVCLWSRVANRVLLPVHAGRAADPDELYSVVREIDWSEHMRVDGTLAVDFYTANSTITHSQYGALKVKDAVVDQFREATGVRPNVERQTPDLRINVYLYRNKARIAIDLSGESLHRRGYREHSGPAPLKENLAAALLLACDWPEMADQGRTLIDPLCGSGTLVTEAALIACNRPPGMFRTYFGFTGWLGHKPSLWEQIKSTALAQAVAPASLIIGCDSSLAAVTAAQQNIRLAGLEGVVEIEQREVNTGAPSSVASPGLLICNPPYGARLDADHMFYQTLGRSLSEHYAGWRCGLFTAKASPLSAARLPLKPQMFLRNGGIDCVLVTGDIPALKSGEVAGTVPASPWPVRDAADSIQPHSQPKSEINTDAFVNRLRKNIKALKSWRKREQINAYRAYDADVPEFAVAIDVYNCAERHVVIQEYQAPSSVNIIVAEARLAALLQAVPDVMDVPPSHVHLKKRERKSGTSQYQKHASKGHTEVLLEAGCQFELNFTDYLDTGMFLDHRKIRRYIQSHAAGKRMLNLFAYAGSATVAAITGGAVGSTSVDLSNRYCRWTEQNIARNQGQPDQHRVVRADVMTWLKNQSKAEFDLILLDPPTFSNSTSVDADWNVQRDHLSCILMCMDLLAPLGVLIFSNNFRRFKLDAELASGGTGKVTVEDRSRWSIDRDFQRNQRIHQCWFIQHV